MFRRLWDMFFTPHRSSQNGTVRFAFPVVAILSVVMGTASIISQERSFISIETTPQSIREGDMVRIDVFATAHIAVNAVDIKVTYPETQMVIEGIDVGESVITLWAEDPYAAAGTIHLRGGTFGKGFIGQHKIAHIRARAIESGTARLTANTVKLIAGDGHGTEIDTVHTDAHQTSIYITNADGSLVGEATVDLVTDIDNDGSVDTQDIRSFMTAWRHKSTVFDFNGDGSMTFRDFAILLADSFFN